MRDMVVSDYTVSIKICKAILYGLEREHVGATMNVMHGNLKEFTDPSFGGFSVD
jgi:hypothetical protein